MNDEELLESKKIEAIDLLNKNSTTQFFLFAWTSAGRIGSISIANQLVLSAASLQAAKLAMEKL